MLHVSFVCPSHTRCNHITICKSARHNLY
uniref:Uncharacterized protein n=1 Tax=Arundo donax TaxID=35708 RepID=A0A0A8Z7N8_ARUDO